MNILGRVHEIMRSRSPILALFLALCLFAGIALGQTTCFGHLNVAVVLDPSISGSSIKPIILNGFDVYVNGIKMGSTDSNGRLSIPASDLPSMNNYNITAVRKIVRSFFCYCGSTGIHVRCLKPSRLPYNVTITAKRCPV
jgi:hypothetical protein